MQFLADWALRSSILILSGGLLLLACRVKDASIRLAAWTAILCGSLAIPLLSAALPKVPLPLLRQPARPVEITMIVEPTAATPKPAVLLSPVKVSPPFDWPRAALKLYVMVAAALLLRLCLGLLLSRRLFRASRPTGMDRIRESDAIASPLTLGIVRPAIVLPTDWRKWDRARLDAVLAHERSHIARHDPAVQLLSAIHRALLWYSPLSWFLHQRIARVAEEASDDVAIAAIHDRATYAEILLEFMQRGVHSQGIAMARYGVPEKRIHRILDATSLSRGVTRWSVAAILTLGAPLAYLTAAVHPQQTAPSAEQGPRFEAASVKIFQLPGAGGGTGKQITARRGPPDAAGGGPGSTDPVRIHYPGVTLEYMLLKAYNVSNIELAGPDFIHSGAVRFDIDATMPANTTPEQFRSMLCNLLADRFKLEIHRETKEVSGYSLTVGKNGPKFKEAAPLPDNPNEDTSNSALRPGPDGYFPAPQRPGVFFQLVGGPHTARSTFRDVPISSLASALQSQLMRPVTDDTGLGGKYDFVLDYSAEGLDLGSDRMRVGPGNPEPQPDLPNALQAQLGLKLEPKKTSIQVIVIDRLEKTPTEN